MSTPQPIKTRQINRSPLPAKKQVLLPSSRWSLLARMKRCKSEPNLPTCPHKKNCAFLNGKFGKSVGVTEPRPPPSQLLALM